MLTKNTTIALLCALFALPVMAKNYTINVNGMVCEFCAHGIGKKIRALPSIDPAYYDRGVKVDIEHQQVFVAVREDAMLNKAALFEAIESGGYDPIDITETSKDKGLKEVDE